MSWLGWIAFGGLFVIAQIMQTSSVPMAGFGAGYNNLYPEYQQEQTVSVYKMPSKRSDKLKAYIECRPDCKSKCGHRLYVMSNNKDRVNNTCRKFFSVCRVKNACHTCLLECITAFTTQADKLGIKLSGKEEKRGIEQRNRRKRIKRKMRHERFDNNRRFNI